MTKERVGIVWMILLILVLSAFAADAMFRDRVCISAMVVDASGTTVYPEVCE